MGASLLCAVTPCAALSSLEGSCDAQPTRRGWVFWLGNNVVTSTARLVDCAEKVLGGGASRQIQVRLLGGVAIWMRALPATRAQLQREYADLDMVAYSSQRNLLTNLLKVEGFESEKRFNAM